MDNRGIPALLFEYERISDSLINFGHKCELKLVLDLGKSDKNNNKLRPFQEYRYKSGKYNNCGELVTATRNYSCYACIEYTTDDSRNGKVFIPPFSILGLRDKMTEFDRKMPEVYRYDEKKEEYKLVTSLIENHSMYSSPTKHTSIECIPDAIQDQNGKYTDMGVKLVLNGEKEVIINYTTLWKSLLLFIMTCDLYGYGISMMNWYCQQLQGNALNEIGNGNYNGNRSYSRGYGADPNDIAESKSINFNRSKPVTKEEKRNDFFNSIGT